MVDNFVATLTGASNKEADDCYTSYVAQFHECHRTSYFGAWLNLIGYI